MSSPLLRRVRNAVRMARRDPHEFRYQARVRALIALYSVANRYGRRRVTGNGPAVVSLTTFGHRLSRVHLAIESIARGAVRPRRLILWVDDIAPDDLPETLRRLQRRGLEVVRCPDYGPHKKQYPYALSRSLSRALTPAPTPDGAELPLVTADDDILYPRVWLRELLAAVAEEPDLINCFRAHTVALTPEGAIAPYSEWRARTDTRPSLRVMATGVSGVAYPPRLLDALVDAGELFLERAPRADDVWVHAVAVRAGIRTRQISAHQAHFPTIPGTQRGTLFGHNVRRGGNDVQIAASYGPDELAALQQAGA